MDIVKVEGTRRNCAIYCRAHGADGPERLERQRHRCEEYLAASNNPSRVAVPERYDDLDVSGATLDRPALQRLLSNIEQGQIQVVVVTDLARLSRRISHFIEIMELLQRHNVEFCSVAEGFDSGAPNKHKSLATLAGMADLERQVSSARITDKIAHSRAQRSANG